jgi:hypothetical protein
MNTTNEIRCIIYMQRNYSFVVMHGGFSVCSFYTYPRHIQLEEEIKFAEALLGTVLAEHRPPINCSFEARLKACLFATPC